MYAENEGQDDLDRATELQLKAESAQDLEEVVKLSESALAKGLDDDNAKFAKQLIVSCLWQRSSQMTTVIFDQPQPHPRWPVIRRLALRDLEKLLGVDPSFADAHVLTGRLLALPDGNRDKALQSLDKAIELYQAAQDQRKTAETLIYRSELHEDAEKTLADVNRAIEVDPTYVEGLKRHAAIFIQKKEYDRAVLDFETLIKKDPQDVSAYQALAEIYAEMEKYDEAHKALDKAIELAPEAALNYSLRADIHEKQDQVDQAVADLDQALKVDPNDLVARYTRARLHFFQDHLDLARKDIDRVLRDNPASAQAILLRSMIAAAEKRFDDAIHDIQLVLRADPANVDLRRQLASLYIASDRPRKAIQILDGILAEHADDWNSLRLRGDAKLSIGQHQEAIADYDVAVKLQPEDDGILNNLAWVLATSPKDDVRNGARAVELATKACQATEYQEPHILSTLAASYAEAGDFENAVKWAEKAVELGREKKHQQLEQLENELRTYREKKPFRESQEIQERPAAPRSTVET